MKLGGWEGAGVFCAFPPATDSGKPGPNFLCAACPVPFPPTPTQVEGEQLSPKPMLVKVSAQHRTNISGEPEGIQHWNLVEKGGIPGL